MSLPFLRHGELFDNLRPRLAARATNGRAHFSPERFLQDGKQTEVCNTRRRLKVSTHLAAGKADDLRLLIDHDVDGRMPGERPPGRPLDAVLAQTAVSLGALRLTHRGRNWEFGPRRRQPVAPLEDATLLVHRGKKRGAARHSFRRAEEEDSPGRQRIVKIPDDPVLQGLIEIDQHIAARHEIQLREGRVFDQAVGREHAQLADFLGDAIVAFNGGEPALQPFGRNPLQRSAIAAGARGRDGTLIDVAAEHLNSGRIADLFSRLLEEDGQGIDLLARRTTRHPDPDLVVSTLAGQQSGNDQALERLESIEVAEKVGHPNQDLAEQEAAFAGLFLQMLDIGRNIADLQYLHAALDTPGQRAVFVLADVVMNAVAHHRGDGLQVFHRLGARPVAILESGDFDQMRPARDQARRHVFRG